MGKLQFLTAVKVCELIPRYIIWREPTNMDFEIILKMLHLVSHRKSLLKAHKPLNYDL